MHHRPLFSSQVLSPVTLRHDAHRPHFSPEPETLRIDPLRTRVVALPFGTMAAQLQRPLQVQWTFGFSGLDRVPAPCRPVA